ncbi:MAG: aldo/keto reductase [Candidatus Limiplasma sp.]|nr:aldo/keto reductase [Candidatus Limiplasma sp.]MEA5145682.1 aldo/keto reductase [Candidatus Limiplasma sp.]
MESIALKQTDLTVSRLCIGGCPAGEYGWGNVSRAEVEQAMLHAVEHGINFFDTADTYGLGRSEETLGDTLRPYRDRVVIATKFGVRVENGKTWYDNSPAYLQASLAASLKRLKTDHIDLYQVHYLDGVTPIPVLMEALIRHQEQGHIRAIGLSNITPDSVPALLPYTDHIATFQNHFSLAHRDDETAMRQISGALHAAPLTWGSLGQGVLTGKYDQTVHFTADDRRSRSIYDNFYGDKLLRNLRIVEAMRPIAKAHGVPVASVAVRWILDAMPGSVVITGVKSPQQAQDNALAMTFTLTPDQLAELDQVSA